MKTFLKTILLTAVVALSFVNATVHAENERYVFVSHAPDSDSWWNTIKNSLRLAAGQYNVEVDYRNPPTGDYGDMARIIEQATASNPDGIIVTIADYDVLSGPIKKAVARGIPVITVNSGTHEQSEALGAMLHIGQPEYDAGFAAGKRAKADGAKQYLCVNHQIANAALTERCRGFAEGLGVTFGSQMLDVGADPGEIKNRVSAYLRSNKDIDAILTLGPTSAGPTLIALDEMGMHDKMYFGTFDLSKEISEGIKSGKIDWAIDQQPFLQGYLAVTFLVSYSRYGVQVPHHVNSGPGFITKATIDSVSRLAGIYR